MKIIKSVSKATIHEVYQLAIESGMDVLGSDGLPLTSLIGADKYYFIHDEKREGFDFLEFFEKCVPSVCYSDEVAGGYTIYEHDGICWIGLDLHECTSKSLPARCDLTLIISG